MFSKIVSEMLLNFFECSDVHSFESIFVVSSLERWLTKKGDALGIVAPLKPWVDLPVEKREESIEGVRRSRWKGLGCSMICLWLEGGGGVILQTANQHAYYSAKFCNSSCEISGIPPRLYKILTIICDLPQVLQNYVKIAAKNNRFERKFYKVLQISRK